MPSRVLPVAVALAVWLGVPAVPAAAQVDALVGVPVTTVRLEIAGQPTDDAQLRGIVTTRPGQPLAMARVRETIGRLFSLGRFEDIRVDARLDGLGVALTYDLVPLRVVERLEFRGDLGVSSRRLRQVVSEQVGPVTSATRVPAAVDALERHYLSLGYFDARVEPRLVARPEPDRARVVFEVDAGVRSRVGRVELAGDVPAADRARLAERLGLSSGRHWNRGDVERRVERYTQSLRDRGYYQAVVSTHEARRVAEALVDVTIDVDPGPLVTLRFEGDPLPQNRLGELVPVAREGSVDEDLLEDSKRRIEDFLRQQGYWRATADYEREEDDDALTVVFRVSRGRPATIGRVDVVGVEALPRVDVEALLTQRAGAPLVEAALDRDVDAIRALYQRRGFTAVRVERLVVTDAMPPTASADVVVPRLVVTEGARRRVSSIRFAGVAQVDETELRAVLRLVPGAPFNPAQLAADRQSVLLAYLNRGYGDAAVDIVVDRDSRPEAVDIVFEVREGDQIRVDQVLVVGNRRTSLRTIQRELVVAPGEPLSLEALVQTQQRLSALGLFRRVRVDDVPLPGRLARDVIVDVEEAPATSIGYGAGLEGGRRLRRAADAATDVAVERLEFAPRGFFEIGRRNLWGKNRSVNLFSRASFRRRDAADSAAGGDSGFGLNEYRVLGTFREPRAFGTVADAQVSAVVEQAIRSSFNFRRRLVNAEMSRRIGRDLTVIGRYGYGKTVLFDERYNPEDKPLIDRLFPQVTLSNFSAASVRDTRDDPLDPLRGSLVGLEGEVAARAIGSEVGYVKGFWQGFVYRRLPGTDRVVVATGVRLGLATGFARTVDIVPGPDGEPTDVVKDVPASERFYAGGDTTIRGFALDRVGAPGTIDQDGFPTGGNGLVILNTELRFPVARALGGVVFLDAGNVFARASDLDLTDLRAGAGVGIRYRSPIGPIRFDVGWKLDPRALPSGSRERAYAFHLSIGQAF